MPRSPSKINTAKTHIAEKSAAERKVKKYFWKKRRTSHESQMSDENNSKTSTSITSPPNEEHSYLMEPQDASPSLPPRMYLHDPEFSGELDVIKEVARGPPSTEAASNSSSASVSSGHSTHDSLASQNEAKLAKTQTPHLYQPLLVPEPQNTDTTYATVRERSRKQPKEKPQYQNMAQLSLPIGSHKLPLVQGQQEQTGQNPHCEEKVEYQNVRKTQKAESLYQNYRKK